METYNRLYGRTRNAYRSDRIVGGSSGGEGAILSALRVLVVEDDGRRSVHPELRRAQQNAAYALARRGARVEMTGFSALRRSFDIWSAMLLAAGGTPVSVMLGNGERIRVWRELGRLLFRRSPHTLPPLLVAASEGLAERMPRRSEKLCALGRELRDEISGRLGSHGVLLYPSQPRPAPRRGRPLLRPMAGTDAGIWNVLELPVTQVPLGLGSEGLPLGVQVATTHGNDHLSIAVAMKLERAFGGWVPPALALG